MILMVIILMSTNGLRGNSRCKLQQIKIIQINYPKDGVGICSVSSYSVAGGQRSMAISLLVLSGKHDENFGRGKSFSPTLMLCVPKCCAEPISQSHSWNIPRDLSSQLVWVFSMFWTL